MYTLFGVQSSPMPGVHHVNILVEDVYILVKNRL